MFITTVPKPYQVCCFTLYYWNIWPNGALSFFNLFYLDNEFELLNRHNSLGPILTEKPQFPSQSTSYIDKLQYHKLTQYQSMTPDLQENVPCPITLICEPEIYVCFPWRRNNGNQTFHLLCIFPGCNFSVMNLFLNLLVTTDTCKIKNLF